MDWFFDLVAVCCLKVGVCPYQRFLVSELSYWKKGSGNSTLKTHRFSIVSVLVCYSSSDIMQNLCLLEIGVRVTHAYTDITHLSCGLLHFIAFDMLFDSSFGKYKYKRFHGLRWKSTGVLVRFLLLYCPLNESEDFCFPQRLWIYSYSYSYFHEQSFVLHQFRTFVKVSHVCLDSDPSKVSLHCVSVILKR